MNIKLTFKDPDNPYEDIRTAVNNSLKQSGLDEEEIEAVFELRMEKTMKKLEKWLNHGECVTLDFDLVKGTAKVLENDG
jgi:hypothetical protein